MVWSKLNGISRKPVQPTPHRGTHPGTRRQRDSKCPWPSELARSRKRDSVAIANALQLEGRSTPRQSLSALISSPMPSLKSLSLSVAVLIAFITADTLPYAVTLNFDLVTLAFDLRPWTFVVYRLCHSQTLYQISAKSSNTRRSYCDLNIWPYDLEHVSRVALCSVIVCAKFKLSQAIHSWNVTIFEANTSCHDMTLNFDPLTLKVCGWSGVLWSQSVVNLM